MKGIKIIKKPARIVKKVAKKTAKVAAKKTIKIAKNVTKKIVKKTYNKAKNYKSVKATKLKNKKPKIAYKINITKKILGHAPTEYHFYLKDGSKLSSLYELIDVLSDMSEDVFYHHVNDMKNDFANWVKDVFNDQELANQIKGVHTRIETKLVLMKKIITELKEFAKI